MSRHWIAVAVVAVAAGLGGASARAAGPPPSLAPSLTQNGRVLWNLDALMNDTFGNRVECWDDQQFEVFSVAHGGYCPAPEARYQEYVFTFLNAFHSEFRLVNLTRPPNTGATNSPIRVGSRYISCSDGEYHHRGHMPSEIWWWEQLCSSVSGCDGVPRGGF